ncbi:maltokinase N-terminal cap-like domain-containing protein [Microlunatus parietis]|uniref:Maltokinase N-terminal cap domain-containing protein n=1 Tax=Microlunatus parietis TaxID=682979 RepID=A0A7Y9I5G3_9ACTN|nr:1,4-alpha-glucan branching protein [Microlunatus parietis]NYE70054.1 hypothetical protein [Microlunatus parietis]
MAVIHRTTVKPTKLELLTAWLPTRSWYGGGSSPSLAKAGGFRLDDPAGEVGLEFLVTTDESGAQPVTYLVPLTYRGAAVDGAEQALVGTTEHGVLGRRWVYDGCHDPVLVGQLWGLIAGRVAAQAQSESHTIDRNVTRSYSGPALPPGSLEVKVTDGQEHTLLATAEGTTVRVHRILRPTPSSIATPPAGAAGHVGGSWQPPGGRRVQGYFATLEIAGRRTG